MVMAMMPPAEAAGSAQLLWAVQAREGRTDGCILFPPKHKERFFTNADVT